MNPMNNTKKRIQKLLIISNQKTFFSNTCKTLSDHNKLSTINNGLIVLEQSKLTAYNELKRLTSGKHSSLLSESLYKNTLDTTIKQVKKMRNSLAA